jgi:hypothetical protein
MGKQETRISLEVNLKEFNRMRPLLTDIDGDPLLEDVTTEELDASGIFEQKDVYGNRICIQYFYFRED